MNLTNTTTPASIRRAQKTAERLANLISNLRYELPTAQNSEQELADGALLQAFENAMKAAASLRSAVRHSADRRTEAEISAAVQVAREEERREQSMRRYGCAP